MQNLLCEIAAKCSAVCRTACPLLLTINMQHECLLEFRSGNVYMDCSGLPRTLIAPGCPSKPLHASTSVMSGREADPFRTLDWLPVHLILVQICSSRCQQHSVTCVDMCTAQWRVLNVLCVTGAREHYYNACWNRTVEVTSGCAAVQIGVLFQLGSIGALRYPGVPASLL